MNVLVSLKTALRFDTDGGSVRAFGFYSPAPYPDVDPTRCDEGSLLRFEATKLVGVHSDDGIFRTVDLAVPVLVQIRRDAVLGWTGVPS